jgi:glycerophosphoryl diester phosphodiesterase
MRFLKYIGYATGILIAIYLTLGLIGGGWGPKVNQSTIQSGELILAHRGLTRHFPENSAAALQAAKKAGYRGAEIDIRMSADETPFLFHDENAKRLLGEDKPFSDLSNADLANKKLKKDHAESGESPFPLKHALSGYGRHLVLYLDVKQSSGWNTIKNVLDETQMTDKVLVASTSAWFILWTEFTDPEINTVLEGFNAGKEWVYSFIPRDFKPDHLASFATKITPSHIAWLKENKLLKYRIAYGVDPTNVEIVKSHGIPIIISDP